MSSVLNLLGPAPNDRKPWFYFDDEYYIKQCLRFGIAPLAAGMHSYLEHYINIGSIQFALSPNHFFSEEFYRFRYPEVAKSIELGRWANGFDHFCSAGSVQGFSPTWFFDGPYCKNMNPDLSEENLREAGFEDIYSHYLLVGISEARICHWIMKGLQAFRADNVWPRSKEDLRIFLDDGLRLTDALAPLFMFDWMKEKYNWSGSIKREGFIQYYLEHVNELYLSPSPYFDELYYRRQQHEVDLGVIKGDFECGYAHFILHGMHEWRRPFAAFDPIFYANTNMPKNVATIAGADAPLAHFLRNRKNKSSAISPPLSTIEIPENFGQALYEKRCAIIATRPESLKISKLSGMPDVSLIVIVRDNYNFTVNCLHTAILTSEGCLEIIIFDNGSRDLTVKFADTHPNIKYIREETNIGFTIAANRAASIAAGHVLIFVNNDIEFTSGAIDFAFERLKDNSVGAVGAKIIRMHGRLQEGGSIIWRDGSCLGYGRDRDPMDGQVNVSYDVDFCSGCFLAVRRVDWQALGGFDEAFAPAYYEETDFCVRLWQSGLRVVYDPRIVIWHYEYGSSLIREEPLSLMRRNQRYFEHKHREYLSKCFTPSEANIERARLRHVRRPRVLFIEDHLPDPAKGMGFVRAASIQKIIGEFAGLVSVIGLHDSCWPTAVPHDQGEHTEILSGINVENIGEFLRKRVGVYDFIWLSRTHNLRKLRNWRSMCPEFFENVTVILDTEAIASARYYTYLNLVGRPAHWIDLIDEELEDVDVVDHICVVNRLDHDSVCEHLNRRKLAVPVSVLGHALNVDLHIPDFADSTDIVLVGAYSQLDSPNVDGVVWFDRVVRPLLSSLKDFRFVIAGRDADRFAERVNLEHHYTIISNPLSMVEIYRSARALVAPTRFAGGIPMKVHEAASFGIPVIMTRLLARQLGWDALDIGLADLIPKAFASAVQQVVSDPHRWRHIQQIQYELIRDDCSPTRFRDTICKLLTSRAQIQR